ncbi:hypothetical protein [Aestuariimicrobium ganziense]|uniref:hypothetical protein n=1 Tax=Aestuariimicrobium ganziense TaxID=2773677 RepID=UPI001F3DC9EB|nr:hypothetical protein [Aestuariimicrobium ganziense]
MSDLNSILEQLAQGRIDAAEAARRIDALKSEPAAAPSEAPAAEQPTASAPPGSEQGGRPQYATHTRESFRSEPDAEAEPTPEPTPSKPVDPDDLPDEGPQTSGRPSGAKGVDRVVVRAVGRRVRIIGDRSVATLSAEGPHVLRRSGRTIEVTSDGDIGPSLGGFSIVRPPRSVEDLRTLGLGKELVVRINPDIAVDAEVTAGSLHCSKVPVLGKVRVTAGGATLEDVAEVGDALVQAGSANVKGAIRQGRSRVKVESGSLNVHLSEGANVTVTGDAQLGRISWPGEHGQVDEYVVGNGSARLDIGVVMGHASLKVAEDEADAKDA